MVQQLQGPDRDLRTLPRRQPTDEEHPHRWGQLEPGRRRCSGARDAVVDHHRAPAQKGDGVEEHLLAERAVDDDPLGQDERQVEQPSDHRRGRALRLVHVADHPAPGQPSEHQPARDGDRVDVDRRGSRPQDQPADRHRRTGQVQHEPGEPARSQGALADHGDRAVLHLGAAGGDLGHQRSRARQRDEHPPALGDHAGDRLEQHPVGPVELGAGVGHQHGRGGLATPRPRRTQPTRCSPVVWHLDPSLGRGRSVDRAARSARPSIAAVSRQPGRPPGGAAARLSGVRRASR
jgi:hypothetical protein